VPRAVRVAVWPCGGSVFAAALACDSTPGADPHIYAGAGGDNGIDHNKS
jgi:hypothetical protein